METINNVHVDDISAFIKLTDEVLKIDNAYCRTSSTRPTPHVATANPSTSSNTTVPKTLSQPRTSLLCSNCGIMGHTVDKCFKAGGGLEGKRDQYLVSRNRVQAHLAHFTEILDSNCIDEPTPTSLDSEPDIIAEPVIPTPPPPIAVLFFTPVDVSATVVVDTEVDNDNFYFGYYTQSEYESLIAFTTPFIHVQQYWT